MEVRIDKWLWAIRVYKTRTQAAEACQKGRIIIGNIQVKPSRNIKIGDVVMVRKLPVIYTYEVTGLIDKRVSASEAQKNFKDLTSVEELNKLNIKETIFVVRDRGTGRPTKKERREIDDLMTSHKDNI
jgi:ribosome-associated heat shock protein Hsp15